MKAVGSLRVQIHAAPPHAPLDTTNITTSETDWVEVLKRRL